MVLDFEVKKDNMASILALERLPLKDKPGKYLLIRCSSSDKTTKWDKLLLAYDSIVSSNVLKQEIDYGKIIYGVNFSISKV